jgi:hypothetical protein
VNQNALTLMLIVLKIEQINLLTLVGEIQLKKQQSYKSKSQGKGKKGQEPLHAPNTPPKIESKAHLFECITSYHTDSISHSG